MISNGTGVQKRPEANEMVNGESTSQQIVKDSFQGSSKKSPGSQKQSYLMLLKLYSKMSRIIT